MSIFQEIYNGRICPIESNVPDTEEYRLAIRKASCAGQKLDAELTTEQKKLWDEYEAASSEPRLLVQEEIFRQAFLMGMQMQQEIDKGI